MILDLVSSDHPLLKTKMDKWDFANPPMDANELANNLIETMVVNVQKKIDKIP